MAQQTNFVKLSIMKIKILNNWFGKFIFVYETQSQTLANANRRSVHLWDTLCKTTSKFQSKITKVILVLKEALENLKKYINWKIWIQMLCIFLQKQSHYFLNDPRTSTTTYYILMYIRWFELIKSVYEIALLYTCLMCSSSLVRVRNYFQKVLYTLTKFPTLQYSVKSRS